MITKHEREMHLHCGPGKRILHPQTAHPSCCGTGGSALPGAKCWSLQQQTQAA